MKTKIKELRIAAKMTQQELADLVHVSSRTIISIEKEQYNPSLMLAYRMSILFYEVYFLFIFSMVRVIQDLVSDCDEYEIRMIADFVRAAKINTHKQKKNGAR